MADSGRDTHVFTRARRRFLPGRDAGTGDQARSEEADEEGAAGGGGRETPAMAKDMG